MQLPTIDFCKQDGSTMAAFLDAIKAKGAVAAHAAAALAHDNQRCPGATAAIINAFNGGTCAARIPLLVCLDVL